MEDLVSHIYDLAIATGPVDGVLRLPWGLWLNARIRSDELPVTALNELLVRRNNRLDATFWLVVVV